MTDEDMETQFPQMGGEARAEQGGIADQRPILQEPVRPEGLPDKFWDAERNEVRTDALYKSYRELEHRFGGMGGKSIPETHEGYEIQPPLPNMQVDPEVNARLHDAGFTQPQVQLVYDLAAEYLGPIAGDLGSHVASEMAAEIERRRLTEHFGGEKRWNELAGQLDTWGRANLGDQAVDELSTSYDGIMRLHSMMQNDEPALAVRGTIEPGGLSESTLKELMRDPRYWRDHDPSYVKRIKEGFEALYPEPD